jgi:DNA-binding Lrp family transcriptional regulator
MRSVHERSAREPGIPARNEAVAEPGAARPGASRERKSMSVTAYVLIQTEVGRSEKVATASRAIAGVVDSDNVAGPYDVIVKVEAPTLDDLAKVVVSELQKVDGITRTFTCPIVNL